MNQEAISLSLAGDCVADGGGAFAHSPAAPFDSTC